MRSRTIYRDKEGIVIKIPCNQVAPYRRGETSEDFATRIKKTFHQLECAEGSRFHIPGWSNAQLKAAANTWRTAGERKKVEAT